MLRTQEECRAAKPFSNNAFTECCVGGLQLARSGHSRESRVKCTNCRIAVSELVAQLTHRLDERQRLDVAHRTADFGDYDVVLCAGPATGCGA